MIVQNVDVRDLLPSTAPFIEVQYLTSFVIPHVSQFAGGSAATRSTTKLWVRGALTYDDGDAAPMGDFLFGECEDYLVNFQEIQSNLEFNKEG